MVQFDSHNGAGKVNTDPLGAAGSEILVAGQRLIAGMRSTTGSGEPDVGGAFGDSALRFGGAEEAVATARPCDDWQGGAARAYADANQRLADRAASMIVLDRGVQAVIAREASQVVARRDNLDSQATYLTDLSHAAGTIARVPGVGPALKAAFDMTAVNTAVGAFDSELRQMAGEVQENCTTLREIANEYTALVSGPVSPGTGDDTPLPAGGTGSESGSELAVSAANPAEAATGITSALGVVGGIIGAVVSPLAAVLSGAAGAAGQSLSALTSPGTLPGVGTESVADIAGDAEDDLVDHEKAETTDGADPDHDAASSQAEAGADATSGSNAAESEETAPLPPVRLDPDRSPAATRPPQF